MSSRQTIDLGQSEDHHYQIFDIPIRMKIEGSRRGESFKIKVSLQEFQLGSKSMFVTHVKSEQEAATTYVHVHTSTATHLKGF